MPSRFVQIITADLVDWLHRWNFPLPETPVRYYPDGCLWTDDPSVLVWNRTQSVAQLIHHKLPGAYTSIRFRSLAAFGDPESLSHYLVLYPGSCDWIGEHEIGALMELGSCSDITPGERNLGHLKVLIRLRKKFTPEIATEFAAGLHDWFLEIGSKGIFGEAEISSISPTLRYKDREAAFELDASATGQETLNTLYLGILNWAMHCKRPLVLTQFAPNPNEPVLNSETNVPIQ